jgi:hypothetical protein
MPHAAGQHAVLGAAHRSTVNETKLRPVIETARDPARLPGTMTVQPIPHHLPCKTADIAETRRAIKLGHAHRIFVAARFANQAPGIAKVGLAATGPQARVLLHPLYQRLEVARRQLEIEIELAEIRERMEINPFQPGIKSINNTRANPTLPAIISMNDMDKLVFSRVTIEQIPRAIGRTIVDDDPLLRPNTLSEHTLQGVTSVLGFIARW